MQQDTLIIIALGGVGAALILYFLTLVLKRRALLNEGIPFDHKKKPAAKIKAKFFKKRIYLINMELRNGYATSFLIIPKEDGFTFMDSKYVIDPAMAYPHVDAKTYALDYHQDFSLPIKKKIDVNLLKTTVEASGTTEIELATNPSVLERFQQAKIAEGVMKGQQIDEYLKAQKLWIIVTAVVVVIHFMLFVYGSGMLSNIKIPGIG